MLTSNVPQVRAAIVVALLFWSSFIGNIRHLMEMQRTVCSYLSPWFRGGDIANLRIGLRLPLPDPSVADFMLVLDGKRPEDIGEPVRSNGVIEVAWKGESMMPLTWRAVALDRAGCIVYAGVAMWSPLARSQTDRMEMPLRRLDVPLCSGHPSSGSVRAVGGGP